MQIKENIKAPRHCPLCGEVTGTGEFPALITSNAGNVSIWWRHHDNKTNQMSSFCWSQRSEIWNAMFVSLHGTSKEYISLVVGFWHHQNNDIWIHLHEFPTKVLVDLLISPDKMAAILADVISRCIFVKEKFCILIKISLRCVPEGSLGLHNDLVPSRRQAIIWANADHRHWRIYLSRQLHCWSLRCSWSIACRRCSNYIFILDWTHGFHGLAKATARRDENRLSFGIWCALY